jgi:hypothetical protein
MAEREKDPKKVAAGQARQAQRRAQLGEDGYRQAQRDLYHAALRRHPALSAIGGQACHAVQREQLGVEGYRQLQAARYRKAVHRYGREWMRERLLKAHAASRAKRLANPTPGEAAVHAFLIAAGYMLHTQLFDYLLWCNEPGVDDANVFAAYVEARIGRFYADVLVLGQHVVLEIRGGVHQLMHSYDAERDQWLRDQGLTVIVIPEEAAVNADDLAEMLAILARGNGEP